MKKTIFLGLLFFVGITMSGCGAKNLTYKADISAKDRLSSAKSITVFTPDVHIVTVSAGNNSDENHDKTSKAVDNFSKALTKSLSSKYQVKSISRMSACDVYSKVPCSNNFINEARDLISTASKSTNLDLKLKPEFQNMFEGSDLLVYVYGVDSEKTGGKVAQDIALNVVSGLLTGYMTTTTALDPVRLAIFDSKSQKLIWLDSDLVGDKGDFSIQEDVETVVTRMAQKIQS